MSGLGIFDVLERIGIFNGMGDLPVGSDDLKQS